MSALAPKPQSVRTDWLGAVAEENRQREEEVKRLRARVAELEQEADEAQQMLTSLLHGALYSNVRGVCRFEVPAAIGQKIVSKGWMIDEGQGI